MFLIPFQINMDNLVMFATQVMLRLWRSDVCFASDVLRPCRKDFDP
jgi:hypothetical protein